MDYLDFDLLIERAGNAYRAKVVKSPEGESSFRRFSMPFSEMELENLLLKIGRTRKGVRRIDLPEVDAAKKFGARLFDRVFEGQAQTLLNGSLLTARKQRAGLRIRLRLVDAPVLAKLPWEYLYNESGNYFLGLSDRTPVIRYMDMPGYLQPLKVEQPLRVLVMIAGPHDYPELKVESEWENLHASLLDLEQGGVVKLERLSTATLPALRRRLHQMRDGYHIFHFVGHGGFDPQTQDGVLVMEDEHGRGHQVSGQTLSILLQNHEQLRLVILNACEGAQGSADDPFTGTAQSIVQQGIPAVIAMQFEITDEAAISFSKEFYMALAGGDPVDAAVAAARVAMFTDGHTMEWGTPVLYLRSPDGSIFDVDPASVQQAGGGPGAHSKETGGDSGLRSPQISGDDRGPGQNQIPLLVLNSPDGAVDPRSRFYIERGTGFIKEIEKTGNGVTIAIKGARQFGKTSLMLRLLEAADKAGKRVALVDLREIDEAYFDSKEKFFYTFCEMIARESGLKTSVKVYWDDQPTIQSCTEFMAALLEESARPLVLALDEVERVFEKKFQSDFFGMLRSWHNRRSRFNAPIWKQLDLVLATSTDPHHFIKNSMQSPFNVATAKIVLGEFSREEVVDLNARYSKPLDEKELDRLIELTAGHPYLTHYALYSVAARLNLTADLFLPAANARNPFREYVFNNVLKRLQKESGMLKALSTVLMDGRCDDLNTFLYLEGAGLVRSDGKKVLMRCELYDKFCREFLNVKS
jgi:hypothetical protein